MRTRMLMRRFLVVAAAARQAASTPLAPSYTSTWTASRAYSCAEAKEHDEIIFDCGGEFISKARPAAAAPPAHAPPPTHRRLCRRRHGPPSLSTHRHPARTCTCAILPQRPNVPMLHAGLLCVVRHAHRPLR